MLAVTEWPRGAHVTCEKRNLSRLRRPVAPQAWTPGSLQQQRKCVFYCIFGWYSISWLQCTILDSWKLWLNVLGRSRSPWSEYLDAQPKSLWVFWFEINVTSATFVEILMSTEVNIDVFPTSRAFVNFRMTSIIPYRTVLLNRTILTKPIIGPRS